MCQVEKRWIDSPDIAWTPVLNIQKIIETPTWRYLYRVDNAEIYTSGTEEWFEVLRQLKVWDKLSNE